MEQLDTTYDHKKYEKNWWAYWEKGGWFHASVDHTKKPYTILIPPPNVTSRLHMGHGLNNTLQDILIRWKRMQGFNACWLPGTDHAGIATQMMVEKDLAKKGQSRQELGREAFVEKCQRWKEENGGLIIEQLKQLGCSCDWERTAYTLDESLSKAVRKIFVDLFKKGLIYRGERLVNWDPVLKTAVSDDEVLNKDDNGHMWHIRYKVAESDDFVTVATTRPETLFGDTAVAVHPEDERYRHLIGRKVVIPFVERHVKVIGDAHVKSEFGTGCLKVTPAHDPNDFEIGKRHQLDFINIMNEDATLNELCPAPFAGLDRYEARKRVIAELKKIDQFETSKPTKHTVPYSDRSSAAIEPRLSKQWYVKMESLALPALQSSKSRELKFYPELWRKTYDHWLENIQDWCISRQLWWGHRIPVWYCKECEQVTVSLEDPDSCEHCQSSEISQDEDVLDTWFSSWLWPISPFGWPEKTKDLDYFFPSNVLITGPDIIFLWVARMAMMSFFTEGKLPFRDVYFNSTICDKQGRKFSKTLGNGIDPLAVIDKFGADAVRYTCISLAPLGGRVKMAESDFDAGNRFINKIWNAARFLLAKIEPFVENNAIVDFKEDSLDLPTKWLVHEFHTVAHKLNNMLDSYQINEAASLIHQFIWKSFCDWGLESAKDVFESKDENCRQIASALLYVFDGLLRLAAPFMPFITEEIWQKIPTHPRWDRPDSLVIANFPKSSEEQLAELSLESDSWNFIQNIIGGIRSLRSQAQVPPREKVDAFIEVNQNNGNALDQSLGLLKKLAGVEKLQYGENIARPEHSLMANGKGFSVYVPVGEYLDIEKEKNRLKSEITRVSKIVNGLKAKLGNENFVARAPQDVVEKTRAQLENMSSQLSSLKENANNFS